MLISIYADYKKKSSRAKLFYVFSPSTSFMMLLSAFPLTYISCIQLRGRE